MWPAWVAHTFPAMVRKALGFLVRLVAASLLVLGISGAGHLLLNPGSEASGPVGHAVVALADGSNPEEVVPPGFTESMGYAPDSLGRPDGSCSTPGGDGYSGFTRACRTHDFGYDLLRYAEEIGEPVGPWARLAIDHRFHRDMIAGCDDPVCRGMAHIYGFAVGLNSVRQGFTPPSIEPTGPWVLVGVVTVAVAGTPLIVDRPEPRPVSRPAHA